MAWANTPPPPLVQSTEEKRKADALQKAKEKADKIEIALQEVMVAKALGAMRLNQWQ